MRSLLVDTLISPCSTGRKSTRSETAEMTSRRVLLRNLPEINAAESAV